MDASSNPQFYDRPMQTQVFGTLYLGLSHVYPRFLVRGGEERGGGSQGGDRQREEQRRYGWISSCLDVGWIIRGGVNQLGKSSVHLSFVDEA